MKLRILDTVQSLPAVRKYEHLLIVQTEYALQSFQESIKKTVNIHGRFGQTCLLLGSRKNTDEKLVLNRVQTYPNPKNALPKSVWNMVRISRRDTELIPTMVNYLRCSEGHFLAFKYEVLYDHPNGYTLKQAIE